MGWVQGGGSAFTEAALVSNLGGARRRLAVFATLLGLLAAAPAARAASWSIQSVPAPQAANGQLFSVSCASSSSCMGVGFYIDSMSVQKMLSEVWNGTSWTLKTVPMRGGTVYGFLHGVSCT